MAILQMGVPKCGNFWLYQIIQKILRSRGLSTESFIERQPIYQLAKKWDLNFPEQSKIDVLEITDIQYLYRISSIYRMPIDDLGKYVSETNHVWTHSPICKRSSQVFHLFKKKIYIIRDPRDRIVSAAKYFTSKYMLKYFPQEEKDPETFLEKNFNILMNEWLWHVFDHMRLSDVYNIHIVFYEKLLTDFQYELDKLLSYLEIELKQKDKLAIEEEVKFENLQAKNPQHLNKGTQGYWKEKLSDQQIIKSEIIAGPLLNFLGYDTGNPCLPDKKILQDLEDLKCEIIVSQKNNFGDSGKPH